MNRSLYFKPLFVLLLFGNYDIAFAHCDTMEGPVISDAKNAIRLNNVNYVLKWVPPENEREIRGIFDLVMRVRGLGPDAEEISDKYFFETLVRLHRSGEGVAYTGIKPAGTKIDEKIAAADRAVESGNLSALEGAVPTDRQAELKRRFERVMSLKNFDINDVPAGREYVEAYVRFFHFVEGEEEHFAHGGFEKRDLILLIPWTLAMVFFLAEVVTIMIYFRTVSRVRS